MADVIVIGAGPAGVFAAYRAAGLGAKTTLVTRDEFGGMAANDGPVPVRTLAHAARLIREARQLDQYGIAVGEPALAYARLLARVREVADAMYATHSARREDLDRNGSDDLRKDRHGTLRRSSHDRNREWTANSGRQNHPLCGRHQPAAPNPRIRIDVHPQ